MRITISDVVTAHDALLASGLALWISDIGIDIEAPEATLRLMIQPVSRNAAAVEALLNVPAPLTSGEAGRGQSEQVASTVAATAAPGVERKKPGRKPANKVSGKPAPPTVVKNATSVDSAPATRPDPPAAPTSTVAAAPGASPVYRGTQKQRILAFITASDKPVTNLQLCKALNIDTASVSTALWSLKNEGKLEKNEDVVPVQWSLA